MPPALPTDITLDTPRAELVITWSDGRVCRYPVGPLRLACPCAECRGGHDKMGREHEPKNLLDLIPLHTYTIDRLELVGNYALQIFWSDGHHSGIYAWDYLARLCPAEPRGA